MPKAVAETDYAFSGVRMHCFLTGKETNGTFCLFENSSEGISGTPVHSHEYEDETIFIHEGDMEVIVDGVSFFLKPGQARFLPRGVPHQLKNTSGLPSRYGILCSPSGFEDFVAEVGHPLTESEQPDPPSLNEIKALKQVAPRFGISLFSSFESKALR